MARFTVWIVRTEGDNHWQGLSEVARGIVYSLETLGHEVAFTTLNPGTNIGDYLIVFNAHRLPADFGLAKDAIIFNAEQVPVDDRWWRANGYLNLLKTHLVWDYSETNIERLRALGVTRIVHCRIGYWPGLSVASSAVEDIDVLFIGSLNERRQKVLDQIAAKKIGLVQSVFNVYGEKRDRWIARAKVVLNVHFYPDPIWEVFRCSHLLANKKCVVSENGGCDKELETLAMATTAYVPYESLAEECATLVGDAEHRRAIANHGHDVFSALNQVGFVEYALGAPR